MNERVEEPGDSHEIAIEGRQFLICLEALYKEASVELSGEWHAWCFFAYDKEFNIYPANAVPSGIATQQSIAGATADSGRNALAAVVEKLKNAIRSRRLDGTGFYCPASDMVYPQDLTSKDKHKAK